MVEMIDAVIPLGPRDRETVAASVRSIRRFVQGVRRIYLVAREDPRIEDAEFVPESMFQFDLRAVAARLGTPERAGWYLQQLIKLYFPATMAGCLDRVLVVDADTIFLRPCQFIDNDRVVLNFGHEFHKPYFEHMARLHPALQRLEHRSGITHCMLFDRKWLATLMHAVEVHHGKRRPFWEIFLSAVDPDHRNQSGASEYEIYFNYCLLLHPKEIIVKAFQWNNVSRLADLRADLYDYVALHWHLREEPIDANSLLDCLTPAQ